MGQVLTSAVLFGGLVKRRWFLPWVEAISSPRCSNSMLWLDMVLTPDKIELERREFIRKGELRKKKVDHIDHISVNADWQIHRRWFADPLTHALILRLINKFPADLKCRNMSPTVALTQYLKLIMPPGTNITAKFISEMIFDSATKLGLRISSFLLSYAEERIKSVSLPILAWDRLLTGKCAVSNEQNRSSSATDTVVDYFPLKSAKKIASLLQQEKMLKELLKTILPNDLKKKRTSSDAREAVCKYYEKNSETMSETLACLALWSIDLLTHYNRKELIGGRVKSSLRASSVQTYVSAIGKNLITAAGKTDILNLESDELHDLYQDSVELFSTAKIKSTPAARLHAFHQFLIARFGAPIVDFSDISVSSGPAELGVSANLLSLSDFDNMKKALCPDFSKASRMRKMQTLIAIIGFRCGLRKNEALKLLLVDFQGEYEPELLVRNNRYAYVKSLESIRRIPLVPLLEEQELKLLMSWRRERLLEDQSLGISHRSESLLFCNYDKPYSTLDSDEVFLTLEQAMRQVTGDQNLSFHKLRHSFATWMLLMLLKDFPPDIRKRFHFLNHPQFDPATCQKRRKALLGNHLQGRQVLYATSQLCGHTSPQVTLLHYLHLCDWLLGIEVASSNNQPNLDAATIMAITGLPQHIVYYDKRKHDMKHWHMSFVLDKLTLPVRGSSANEMDHPAASSEESLTLLDAPIDPNGGELQPQRFKEVDTKLIPEKTLNQSDQSVPYWQRVVAMVNEWQIVKLPFDALALKHSLDDDTIERWCDNARRSASMKTKHGKLRHVNGATYKNNPEFKFPIPLHMKEDRNFAKTLLDAFMKFPATKQGVLVVDVGHFVEHYNVGESGIRFTNLGSVKKHLRFLRSLGISDSQILVIRARTRTARLPAEDERENLGCKLKLPIESITVRNLYKREYSTQGEYLVKVSSPVDPDQGLVKKSYGGFKFAMYVIAIMCVWELHKNVPGITLTLPRNPDPHTSPNFIQVCSVITHYLRMSEPGVVIMRRHHDQPARPVLQPVGHVLRPVVDQDGAINNSLVMGNGHTVDIVRQVLVAPFDFLAPSSVFSRWPFFRTAME